MHSISIGVRSSWSGTALLGSGDPGWRVTGDGSRILGHRGSDGYGPVVSQRPKVAWTSRQRWALVAMSISNFAVALDFLGVNVALPAIGRDLGGGTGGLQWVTTAYLLTLTTALVPAGRAADLYGRSRVCVLGLVVFAAGSIVSAVAGTIEVLAVGRGLTGLGAAVLTATTLAIVSDAFPDHATRGPAIGVWTAIGAVGSALGPPIAGVVTQEASWRWFLVLAVPLTGTALAFIVRGVARASAVPGSAIAERSDSPGAMDWVGAALLIVAFGAFVVAVLEGPDIGWGSPIVVGGVVLSLVALALLIRRERASRAPLVAISRLRNGLFAASAGVAFIANIAFACLLFFMTLYLQQVRGLSPSEAGLVFLALSGALVVGSPIAGRLVARIGTPLVMAAGMALLTVSFVLLGLVGIGTGMVLVVGGLALSGLGQAFAFDASNTAALDAVADTDAGAAAGLVSGARQAGALLGLVVAGGVFRLLEGHTSTGASRGQAFLDGFLPTMLGVGVCCFLGIAVAFRGRSLRA